MPSRKHKAWFINAEKKVITQVMTTDRLQTLYKLLGFGCDEIRAYVLNGSGDSMFYDCNAVSRAQTNIALRNLQFNHKRILRTFVGNAVILGTDEFGNCMDVHADHDMITREITFL